MGMNLENNSAILIKDIELETQEIKQKEIRNNKIIYRTIKRLVDILGGGIGVITLIPITTILYIINKISKENRGPVFYTQLRIGKDGKEFKFYKYRSMVMHADEKLWEYLNTNSQAKEEYRKYKKLKYDPRVTKFGEFLRKTSLDEFPQFINVLKGDMSLVGQDHIFIEKKEIWEKNTMKL